MKHPSLVFTIFGSTGDLTYRKLIPALYHLEQRQLLADDFKVRCIGRRDYSREEYIEKLVPWLEKQSRFKVKNETLEIFFKRIEYINMEFTDLDAYQILSQYPAGKDNLYYFAVAPEFFGLIAQHLHDSKYLSLGQHRVILEKPFGDSLEHAKIVHQTITEIFGDDNIYHIDHYLGKEMIQNILAIRFSNRLFKSTWNRNDIEAIQITVSEVVGVETRGHYYEQAGALKDMVQNHLLQMLSYLIIDEPHNLNSNELDKRQLEALRSLVIDDVVLGQYDTSESGVAYISEKNVKENSQIETYAAIRAHLISGVLKDVPLFLRTGKRLNHKATYIKVIFKKTGNALYPHDSSEVLTIKVQPDEGVSLSFNAKKPGTLSEIDSVKMDFCQSCIIENRINTPEAYERLLDDAFKHDRSLFTPWEMVELGWMYGEEMNRKRVINQLPLNLYPAGSRGPIDADEMLKPYDLEWLDEDEYSY